MKKQWMAWALVAAAGLWSVPQKASAWPAFAAAYPEARDASGKIVCSNCHLGLKQTEVEFPQSVEPGQVFNLKVKVPWDPKVQEVGADGSPAVVQLGAYIQLPKGFNLAPEKEWDKEAKEAMEKYPAVQLYADKPEKLKEHPTTYIINQIGSDQVKDQEFIVPIKAPDPNAKGVSKEERVNFGKYSLYVGANRGRGQVYSNGTASNNAQYTSPVAGTVANIEKGVKVTAKLQYGLGTEPVDFEYENGERVTITDEKGKPTVVNIPPGPKLLETLKVGAKLKAGDPLTNDPNVGGFGQEEGDIVLQDPQRVTWLIAFLAAAFVCQLLLVLKKKQVEKVQEYEAEKQGL
ncbi:apocytochrome f [Gloeobacter kilaueensis]|uniref:Cytochrome f n=1 Tax=Gloeobacter kilaueensis (strain ATCC BAA-2537 / CCAP 1431/1 / ULC 316 / JS1) TaxID=1183438 RepID=U5QFZ3_GLOK1|nr:apocytochrome f [Gloeobacter kilaueensis]AGY56559.1 apocytochrome f [Gloeobacter kilaueensis JS1]